MPCRLAKERLAWRVLKFMSTIKFRLVTPQGKSAIATVVVVGENAIQFASRVFRAKNRMLKIEKGFGRVLYGNWITDQKIGEDLILCPINRDRFEIHCHGSIAAVDIIVQTLQHHGAVASTESDLAGDLSGNQYFGEMQIAISQAPTLKVAKLLVAQSRNHHKFWGNLKKLAQANQVDLARQQLEQFIAWQEFGCRLITPFQVVFCGRPNAGKSSLVNAILGFQRAIVHEQEGTTRDVVQEATAIDGWPVVLSDTAGFRESNDPIEQQGMTLAQESIGASDLLILVSDLTRFDPASFENEKQNFQPDLVIGNKIDLAVTCPNLVDLCVSASESINVDNLMCEIINRLIPQLPNADQAIPVSETQVAIAHEIRQSILDNRLSHARELIESILSN